MDKQDPIVVENYRGATRRLGAEEQMADKHQRQIALHEERFGKLGELQTKKQKRALKLELAER